ncbi:uncharacterized protein PAC_04968 [Phialocephala subalpina]|uniref:Uncharacterized protein n=1 Tax=Phialocephala subalpina TaxID=576137 RepID=A0A1L7WQN7_9HELO|nr:uncharacterized protein PAC_04968 [Phialocephala subalpina]
MSKISFTIALPHDGPEGNRTPQFFLSTSNNTYLSFKGMDFKGARFGNSNATSGWKSRFEYSVVAAKGITKFSIMMNTSVILPPLSWGLPGPPAKANAKNKEEEKSKSKSKGSSRGGSSSKSSSTRSSRASYESRESSRRSERGSERGKERPRIRYDDPPRRLRELEDEAYLMDIVSLLDPSAKTSDQSCRPPFASKGPKETGDSAVELVPKFDLTDSESNSDTVTDPPSPPLVIDAAFLAPVEPQLQEGISHLPHLSTRTGNFCAASLSIQISSLNLSQGNPLGDRHSIRQRAGVQFTFFATGLSKSESPIDPRTFSSTRVTMAGEASKQLSIGDAKRGFFVTPSSKASISDVAGDYLYGKMGELSTTRPPASRPAILGNTSAAIVPDSVEQSEMKEYRGIIETLKGRLWADAKLREIQEGSWAYKQDALEKDKKRALDSYVTKHEKILPDGLNTRAYLLKDVLSEVQLELGGVNRNRKNSVDSYQAIKEDLRNIKRHKHTSEFLEQAGTMTDDEILSFYKGYLPKWTDISLATLRRAANAIEHELLDEREREKAEKSIKENRRAAVQRVHRYNDMIRQGMSSQKAMAKLAKEYKTELEKSLPVRDIHKELEMMNRESLVDVCKHKNSDIEMGSTILEFETRWSDWEKGTAVHIENVDGAGRASVEKAPNVSIREVVSDQQSSGSSVDENWPDVPAYRGQSVHGYEQLPAMEARGRGPGSPPKRRIVSGDDSPSPTKKGRASPERSKRGTRDVACPVKK